VRLAALVLVVCACGAPDRDPKWKPAGSKHPRSGGTLEVATKDQFRSLDPTFTFEEVSTYITQPLFATLVTYAPASPEPGAPAATTIVPDLAERWQIDPDRVTYRFYLRDKLVYEDGTRIVAGDFKFSLERALRTADSPFYPFLVDVVGATEVIEGKATDCAGIVAVSDRELQIRLVRPSPSFLFILTMKFATPQRSAWVAEQGDQLRRHPLASGPFRLESWSEGTELRLVRNDNYWDKPRPYLDAIVMRENIPRDTQFLMFERGELDTAEKLSAPDYVWIMDQPAWQPYLHHTALMQVFGARMNVTKKPFTDRRVRQALNYALNKAHTVKLLNNAAVPSHGMLPPGMLGRDDALEPYPYDPVTARKLLAEAGVAPGTQLTYVTQNDEQGETLAASLKGDLEEVGFIVNVQLVSFATLSTISGSITGPDFSMTSWIGDYPDPTNFLDVRFHSRAIADENATNDTRYSNPALDALLDAARGELDPAKRVAMYKQAERILYDDAPWIYDYHPVTTEVTQPYVRGFELHPIWVRDYTHTWLDPKELRVPQ
jgi:ABC-type transport system substrate-binding protein